LNCRRWYFLGEVPVMFCFGVQLISFARIIRSSLFPYTFSLLDCPPPRFPPLFFSFVFFLSFFYLTCSIFPLLCISFLLFAILFRVSKVLLRFILNTVLPYCRCCWTRPFCLNSHPFLLSSDTKSQGQVSCRNVVLSAWMSKGGC